MSSSPVIIFGPTGAVGRAAALEASKRNAKVWLAMRNTSKKIPDLDDKASSFTRVPAGLSQPDTLKSAVEQSGAKAAFVYTLEHSADAMKASFEALKAAGITYIVLLGSFKVVGEASDEKNLDTDDAVRKVHAATEIALKEVGVQHVTLRLAFFDSNLHWRNEGINEAFGVVGKALGREIKVREIDEQTYLEHNTHMPRAMLDLTDVYIDPPCQGKGLGAWLTTCVREVIGSMPYLRQSMLCTSDWKRSVPFHEKVMGMEIMECKKGANGESGKEVAIMQWKRTGVSCVFEGVGSSKLGRWPNWGSRRC